MMSGACSALETSTLGVVVYAPFLIWGDGRHLRLPFLLRARNNLDFVTRKNAGRFLAHLGGPRRNQSPAKQGKVVESTAN